MRRALSLHVPALAVALVSTAQAQDPKPALTELRLYGQPARAAGHGNFVQVVGRGLHRCPTPVTPSGAGGTSGGETSCVHAWRRVRDAARQEMEKAIEISWMDGALRERGASGA